MYGKLFTLDEANALLPQIKEDIATLQSLVTEIEDRQSELQKIKTSRRHSLAGAENESDPYFEMESQLDFMRMEAQLLMGNFARKGVLLKMVSPGLIDFPAVLDGNEILMCWQEGEESITHYHGWHDGFAGRKRLTD